MYQFAQNYNLKGVFKPKNNISEDFKSFTMIQQNNVVFKNMILCFILNE